MASMTAAEALRDYETDGVPSSGPHEVKKSDLRTVIGNIELLVNAGGIGSAVWKVSKTALLADLSHGADTLGVVHDDPVAAQNGLYVKSGVAGFGSWGQITTFLPGYQFVTAINDGNSTANAYFMDTSPRLPAGDGVALVSFVVPLTNTSSVVSVSFDADPPLLIKTASGNEPAVGGLIEGMPISGVKIGPAFYMRSDQASAALLAQIENKAIEVQEIVDSASDALVEASESARHAAQAAATEAEFYALMVGAAVYDFSFDSDPDLPGYDWSE